MVDERCAACHRIFNARSKPRWAFTQRGFPAGRVHTSCERQWPGFVLYSDGESATNAHFWAWIRYFRPGEQTVTEWDVLGCLMLGPDDPWGQRQEEALVWLAEGPNKRTPEQVAAVRVAYHRLIGEFENWRASLVPGSR